MLPFIQTVAGDVSVMLDGVMYAIPAGQPHHSQIVEAIQRGASEQDVLKILRKDIQRVSSAIAALSERKITGDVSISEGAVMFRGQAIDNTLTSRMLRQLNEGFDLAPMARFLENLMQNPSHRAVQDLYSFLEYGHMPITENGHFRAYKAVRKDFRDIYSGDFDNSIGAIVEMPRNQVDEDPDRPCSKGLHSCSFGYLPHYAHADGHVVICEINPRDVVAIPRDYNLTKIRVCRYQVVGEYKDYYSSGRSDVLADVSVATPAEPFVVTVDGNAPQTLRFTKLSDAANAADDALALQSTQTVTLENAYTASVIEWRTNPHFEGKPPDADVEQEMYDVVYGSSAEQIQAGLFKVYADGIEGIDDAKDMALDAQKENPGFVIQVRSDVKGVRLTLS